MVWFRKKKFNIQLSIMILEFKNFYLNAVATLPVRESRLPNRKRVAEQNRNQEHKLNNHELPFIFIFTDFYSLIFIRFASTDFSN